MKCPKCQADNPDDANFCFCCGSDLHKVSDEVNTPVERELDNSTNNADDSAEEKCEGEPNNASNETNDTIQATNTGSLQRQKYTKKRLLIIFLSILIIAGIVIAFAISSIHRSYVKAVDEYNAGNFETAIEYFSTDTLHKDSAEYLQKCYLGLADQLYSQGEYVKAKEQYALANTPEAEEHIKACDYQLAITDFNNKQYDDAKEKFSQLSGYSDSENYLQQIRSAQKYQFYGETHPFLENPEQYWDAVPQSEAEDTLARAYRHWYRYDSELYEFDFSNDSFMENEYYVTGEGFFENLCVVLYFVKDGKKTFAVMTSSSDPYFSLTGESVDVRALFCTLFSEDGTPTVEQVYYDRPKEEMRQIIDDNETYWIQENAKWEQQAAEQEAQEEAEAQAKEAEQLNAVKQRIYDDTFSRANDNLNSAFYEGAGSLYHHTNVDNCNIYYDPDSGNYVCSMELTYTTNVFDFYGNSNMQFLAYSEYKVIDGNLVLVSFDIM